MERELFKLREPLQGLYTCAGEEPEIVYYYCSIPTFINIIKKHELWLTSTADMNDYLESQWIEGILKQFLKKSSHAAEHPKVIPYFSNYFFYEYFLCCFSSGRDVLSQWRAYADDGRGFAIGVDTFALKALAQSRVDNLAGGFIDFFPVVYDQELQARTIEDVFAKVCAYGKKFGVKNIKGIQDQIHLILNYMSITFKNTAFSEEKEWRLAKPEYIDACYPMFTNNYQITERDYRAAKASLSPFHRFLFGEDFLREVVLGPKNTSNKHVVYDFLCANKHINAWVSESSASYR